MTGEQASELDVLISPREEYQHLEMGIVGEAGFLGVVRVDFDDRIFLIRAPRCR